MSEVDNGHDVLDPETAKIPEGMSPKQEAHLAGILRRFVQEADAKYRKGQQEHGGDLWKKPGMLGFLREECLDFVVYADTLQAQIQEALLLLRRIPVDPFDQNYERAMSILNDLCYTGPEAREAP